MINSIQQTFQELYGVDIEKEESMLLGVILTLYRNRKSVPVGDKFQIDVRTDIVNRINPNMTEENFHDVCLSLYTYQLEVDTEGFVSFCRLFDVVINDVGKVDTLLVNKNILDCIEARLV